MHPRGVPDYIEFLKRAFNAEVEIRAEHQGIVMHARLKIGTGAIEMGDTQGQSEPMRTGFYLYVPDADAVYAQAVAAGATPLAAPTDQSYGDRMGSVRTRRASRGSLRGRRDDGLRLRLRTRSGGGN